MKEQQYTIIDPATMRLVHPDSNWRDRLLSSLYHGITFTMEEAGDTLSYECKMRGNKETTQEMVKTQPFNYLLKHGYIIPVNSVS